MEGWIESWLIGVTLTSLGLYKFRSNNNWLKLIFKSLISIVLTLAEIFFLVYFLKFDLMYGFLLMIAIPILLPINKVLIDRFESKTKANI